MVTYLFKPIMKYNTCIWFDFSNNGYLVKKGEYSPYDLSKNKHLAIQNKKLYEPTIFKDGGLSYARFQNNELNNVLINPHYEISTKYEFQDVDMYFAYSINSFPDIKGANDVSIFKNVLLKQDGGKGVCFLSDGNLVIFGINEGNDQMGYLKTNFYDAGKIGNFWHVLSVHFRDHNLVIYHNGVKSFQGSYMYNKLDKNDYKVLVGSMEKNGNKVSLSDIDIGEFIVYNNFDKANSSDIVKKHHKYLMTKWL